MKRAGAWTALAVGMALAIAGCSQKPIAQVRADANAAYFDGAYEAALPLYEEVVNRHPGDAKGHYELGRNLLKLGKASEAREQMILAYNLEPANMEYFDGMADAYVAAGNEDDLFAALDHRVRDRGGAADYMAMGRYAEKLGHADEAERAYLSAAEIDGGKTREPQIALANFYKSIGDEANEIKRLRMALWFDQADAGVNARLRSLGQVPGPSFVLTPAGRE
jgi:cytochrome c-type biogenesis protein CcmH/NrfG